MINLRKTEKFSFKKLGSKKNVIRFIIDMCLATFLILMLLRKEVFPSGSFLNTVFDDDPSITNSVGVKWFKTLMVIMICVVAMELSNMVAFIGRFIKSNKAKTILFVVGNGAKYLCGISILFFCLAVWGVNTAAIVTSASVLTLAISLGCQSMISDIVSGLFILFEGDVKVGDVVVIDGWRGKIEQIGIRRTRIVDTLGNVNIINNSSITNIINNSVNLSVAVIEVGIEYGSDLQHIEEVINNNLENIKQNIPAIVNGPRYLGVSSLGASSVNLKINAQCKEEDKFQVERDLNREIKLLFDKNNINIPFPQVVVNCREENK